MAREPLVAKDITFVIALPRRQHHQNSHLGFLIKSSYKMMLSWDSLLAKKTVRLKPYWKAAISARLKGPKPKFLQGLNNPKNGRARAFSQDLGTGIWSETFLCDKLLSPKLPCNLVSWWSVSTSNRACQRQIPGGHCAPSVRTWYWDVGALCSIWHGC